MEKIVYSYHPATREFVGPTVADESPLEPGVWLHPANTTEAAPPDLTDNQRAVWNGTAWDVENLPPAAVTPPAPWTAGPMLDLVRGLRETVLNRLTGIGARAYFAGDTATASACATAQESLLDITKDPAVLAATDDATLQAALVAAYGAIVAAAPASLRAAFAEFRL